MDTYADDLAALIETLNLLTRYWSAIPLDEAVLVGLVPPLMLKTEAKPDGLPIEAFDQIRTGVSRDRTQFYKDLSVPFCGAKGKSWLKNVGAPYSKRGVIQWRNL